MIARLIVLSSRHEVFLVLVDMSIDDDMLVLCLSSSGSPSFGTIGAYFWFGNGIAGIDRVTFVVTFRTWLLACRADMKDQERRSNPCRGVEGQCL